MTESYSEEDSGSFDWESLLVSSRDLAVATGKAHRNILRDIRREVSTLQEDLKKLDLSVPEQAEYSYYVSRTLNGFQESSYKDEMNRDQIEILMDNFAVSQLSLGYSPAIRCYVLGSLFDIEKGSDSCLKTNLVGDILPKPSVFRHVYIIKNTETGRVKVGVGTDPEKRLKKLQTGNDCLLELVYISPLFSNALAIETEVHRKFQDRLVRGEWFDVSEREIIRFLDQHRESFPNHR